MDINFHNGKLKNLKLVSLIFTLMMIVLVGIGGSVSATSSDDEVLELGKKGYEYLDSNQCDKAIELFNQALAIDSGNASIHYALGSAYFQKSMGDKAIEELTKSAELAPEHAWTYAIRGSVYAIKGLQGKAKADFNLFFKYVQPNDPRLPAFKKYLVKLGYTKKITTVSSEIGNKTMNYMLIHGVGTNDIDMVKKAVENGANVNIFTNGETDTPLTLSIYQKDTSIFDYLIEQGADINVQLAVNGCGSDAVNTPLLKSLHNISLVEKLIKLGADVNVRGIYGLRPIGTAISNGYSIEIIKILVANNAEIDYGMTGFYINGATPLMYAIDKKNLEVVQFLLNSNASKTKKDSQGRTALDHAIASGDKNIIYLLMN